MSAQHPTAAETGPVQHRKGLKLGSNPTGQERHLLPSLVHIESSRTQTGEKVDPVILNQYFMNAALFMARAKVIASCGEY